MTLLLSSGLFFNLGHGSLHAMSYRDEAFEKQFAENHPTVHHTEEPAATPLLQNDATSSKSPLAFLPIFLTNQRQPSLLKKPCPQPIIIIFPCALLTNNKVFFRLLFGPQGTLTEELLEYDQAYYARLLRHHEQRLERHPSLYTPPPHNELDFPDDLDDPAPPPSFINLAFKTYLHKLTPAMISYVFSCPHLRPKLRYDDVLLSAISHNMRTLIIPLINLFSKELPLEPLIIISLSMTFDNNRTSIAQDIITTFKQNISCRTANNLLSDAASRKLPAMIRIITDHLKHKITDATEALDSILRFKHPPLPDTVDLILSAYYHTIADLTEILIWTILDKDIPAAITRRITTLPGLQGKITDIAYIQKQVIEDGNQKQIETIEEIFGPIPEDLKREVLDSKYTFHIEGIYDSSSEEEGYSPED